MTEQQVTPEAAGRLTDEGDSTGPAAGEGSGHRASHDIGVPDRLAAFMATGWAGDPDASVPEAAVAPYCAKRRAALSARFPGEALVVPSGGLKVRANDTDYPFRPGSDFFWLTGEAEPDGVLVMEPSGGGHTATLYVPPRSDRSTHAFYTDRRYGELWVGPRRGLAETAAALGIDTAPLSDLPDRLDRLAAGGCRVVRDHDPTVEARLGRVPVLPGGALMDLTAAADPGSTEDPGDADGPEDSDRSDGAKAAHADPDHELSVVLSEMRLVKDDHEVAMLAAAIAATVRGFEDVVRELDRAVETSERWVEGTFYRRARVDGNDVGYGSICAAGPHATTLHWGRNDGPVRPGDLLLVDMGVESKELYTADVTRTVPVSGRWTGTQRRLYEVVLRAQQAGIDAVRPGAAFLDPHRAAMAVIAEALADWGILPVEAEESLSEDAGLHRRYTLHGTSHMLGIDVHDCAHARNETYRDGTLEAGMVLTVEPGLYFQADDETVPAELRGIGIRIEDDVLVTEHGYENLSAALPRDPDEIEAWMAALRG